MEIEAGVTPEELAFGAELASLLVKYEIDGAVIACLLDEGHARVSVVSVTKDGFEFVTSFGPYVKDALGDCISDRLERN